MQPELAQILHMHFRWFLSERYFRATGLTSVIGNSLNGKVCSVRGYDFQSERLRCKFSHERTLYMIKGQNLMLVKGFDKLLDWQQRFPGNMSLSKVDLDTVGITGEKFLATMSKAVNRMMYDDIVRTMYCSRVIKMLRALQSFLLGIQKHEEILCCDLDDVQGEMFEGQKHALEVSKRPCVGTGKVDFRDYACHMDPQSSSLMMRFKEYIISGFCVKCQIYVFEMHNA